MYSKRRETTAPHNAEGRALSTPPRLLRGPTTVRYDASSSVHAARVPASEIDKASAIERRREFRSSQRVALTSNGARDNRRLRHDAASSRADELSATRHLLGQANGYNVDRVMNRQMW
ncbi:unnamed protein product, partial [Iphiclides podalirius]